MFSCLVSTHQLCFWQCSLILDDRQQESMEERAAVLNLSETFAKINEDDIFRTNAKHDQTKLRLTENDNGQEKTRLNPMIKGRSLDLNNDESSKIKSLCKTKSLSSHFVVNIFDEQCSNNPHKNEKRGLLSLYQSSSSSQISGKAWLFFFLFYFLNIFLFFCFTENLSNIATRYT